MDVLTIAREHLAAAEDIAAGGDVALTVSDESLAMARHIVDSDPLTLADTVAIAMIVDTAQRTAPVARLIETGSVVYGTARSVGLDADHGFIFLGATDDVRDAFLRVTTANGFDVAWPIRDLIPEVRSGEFCADVRPA